MKSKDVYIVAARRSPSGKAFKGGLATKRPDDLCADVIKGVLAAAGSFDHSAIDDVYIGCAMPEAEQGMNVARFALLLAGLPDSVPGVTINRFCSSGLQSIGMAADRIRAGEAECILAGGTESMTLVPMMGHKVVGSRTVMNDHPDFYIGMGHTAENVADKYGISREMQDVFSAESHRKAAEAIRGGLFKNEIIPIQTEWRRPAANGGVTVEAKTFSMDDGVREDSSPEGLAKLKPAFKQGGTVTAGNSSQMSDGAAACLVCSEDFLKVHGLKPEARFISFQVAGVPPSIMGIGPIEAIPRVLKKAGIKLQDVGRIELNEAFASQALAVLRTLELNPDIVNRTGGAIALGHPLGATGAKLTATLIQGMKRDKQRFGLVSMCIGTGMGAAGLFENI